jgi:hypothetical protein
MADSISNGIGKRLKKQEQKAHLRAWITAPFVVDDHVLARIPIDYRDGEGVGITGGVVEVLTSGLYFVSVTLELEAATTLPLDAVLRRNADGLLNRHAATSTISFVSLPMTTIVPLVQGDKLYVEARIGNPGNVVEGSAITLRETDWNMVMLYAD